MSKLGRHRRTIELPDDEPWVLPEPRPDREEQRPSPAPVREREHQLERVPARR